MKKRPLLFILADDDEDDRLLFTEALSETSETKVITVSDGEALLLLLKNTKKLPDLVFLDINMPFASGLDILKSIKEDKKYESVPVVMYSTSSNPKNVEAAFKNGASLYIPKPNSYNKICKMFSTLLSLPWEDEYLPQPEKTKFLLKL